MLLGVRSEGLQEELRYIQKTNKKRCRKIKETNTEKSKPLLLTNLGKLPNINL